MDRFMISVTLFQPQGADNACKGSSTIELNVHPSQSGCQLRNDVARMSGKSPADLRLVFAGKLIEDVHTMKDLNIAENTTVHAVPAPRGQRTTVNGSDFKNKLEEMSCVPSSVSTLLLDSVVEGQAQGEHRHPAIDDPTLRPSFYVYCRSHCQSVQPGKLRVRCRSCKDHAFVVSEDPTCWDDVILKDRISGSCLVPGCSGHKAEFYFKCASHVSSDEDRVIILSLIKSNVRRVMCITCADVLNSVLVFPCAASHVMCLDCFSQYCRLCLDERRFIHNPELGYTLPCPAGCADSLIQETHHFLVLGKEQYTRYKRFGAEECLLQEGGVLCPSPGCGAGILPACGERRVTCQMEGGFGCGFVFCRNCHDAFHEGECGRREGSEGQATQIEGQRLDVDLQRERHARWEQDESRQTIENTSKPCPKCKVPVERNGGCMHMTCSRAQCKFEWCWVCSIEWNMSCLEDHWFGTDMLL